MTNAKAWALPVDKGTPQRSVAIAEVSGLFSSALPVLLIRLRLPLPRSSMRLIGRLLRLMLLSDC